MPRAKAMMDDQSGRPKLNLQGLPDGKYPLYWADTGPVEIVVEDSHIIEADPIDSEIASWTAGND
jgi:hypothetical protein